MPEGPLQIIVSLRTQKLSVYDRDGLFESTTVSTGTGSHPTPTGVFAILEKSVHHRSNIYHGAPMPYMQRLTMSGVALHQGMVTGRPASHGCVRLPPAFAPHLFKITNLGARVIVMDGEAQPQEIEHPALFVHKPLPTVDPDAIEDPAEKARALAASIGREMEAATMLARIGSVTAWRRDELRKLPVSVFVSRAEQRVFVRHGFSPLFDAPARIANNGKRIGTHVFTALERKGANGAMRWSVVTLVNDPRPPDAEPEVARARGRFARQEARATQTPIVTAALSQDASAADEALDRIDIPEDTLARINDRLSPGASLIVSDEGPSHEMRVSGTDFVVLTR